jgi:hypothetical protein
MLLTYVCCIGVFGADVTTGLPTDLPECSDLRSEVLACFTTCGHSLLLFITC